MDKQKLYVSYMKNKPDYIKSNPVYYLNKDLAINKEYNVSLSYYDMKVYSDLSREDLRYLFFIKRSNNNA